MTTTTSCWCVKCQLAAAEQGLAAGWPPTYWLGHSKHPAARPVPHAHADCERTRMHRRCLQAQGMGHVLRHEMCMGVRVHACMHGCTDGLQGP